MAEILDLLHDSEERRFAAGEVILKEGGTGGPLLFLAEGSVEVVLEDVQIATTSQRGTVFGVFSLLPAGRDAATIRALEPCVFRVIQNPRAFLKESPLVCWHVCETIAHRLATLTAYLCDVHRQFAGNDAWRLALVSAMPFSLPALICDCTVGIAVASSGICPASTSMTAWPPPLYAICVNWVPVRCSNSSIAKCGVLA